MSSVPEGFPGDAPVRLSSRPHLLVVLNPGSNQFDAADRLAKRYVEQDYANWATDIVHTDPDASVTKSKVYEKLAHTKDRYDAVACLTGDGGANPVASLLVGTEIPLYLGGFGSINDGHVITVGKEEQGVVANQPVVPIYPLRTRIHEAGKMSEEIALFYQGLGYTALAAEMVNGDTHRKSVLMRTRPTKKIREGMTVAKAWLQSKPFEVEDLIAGGQYKRYEYLISNGARMAGMSIYPGNPAEFGFKKLELSSKPGPVIELGKLTLLHNIDDWSDDDHMGLRIITRRPNQTVPLQFDGETRRLANGTLLHTRSSEEPLYVVAPALAS